MSRTVTYLFIALVMSVMLSGCSSPLDDPDLDVEGELEQYISENNIGLHMPINEYQDYMSQSFGDYLGYDGLHFGDVVAPSSGGTYKLERSWSSQDAKEIVIGVKATNIRQKDNKLQADVILSNYTMTWVYVEQDFTWEKVGQVPVRTQGAYLLGPSYDKNLGTIEFSKDSFLQFNAKTAIGTSPGTQESNMLLGALAVDLAMRGFFNEELSPNAFDSPWVFPIELGLASISPLFFTVTSHCSGPLGALSYAVVMKDRDSALEALGIFLLCSAETPIQDWITKLFSKEIAEKWAERFVGNIADLLDLPMKATLLKILTEYTFNAPPESWVRINAVGIHMPIKEYKENMSQSFGNYRDQKYDGFHGGEDIGCAAGTLIYAIADGVVAMISDQGAKGQLGKLIALEHPGTFTFPACSEKINGQTYQYLKEPVEKVYSVYVHVSHLSGISIGVEVEGGKEIGKVADISAAGLAPHLHFEIRRSDQDVHDSSGWGMVGDRSNWSQFEDGTYNGYYKNLQTMVDDGLRHPSDFLGLKVYLHE